MYSNNKFERTVNNSKIRNWVLEIDRNGTFQWDLKNSELSVMLTPNFLENSIPITIADDEYIDMLESVIRFNISGNIEQDKKEYLKIVKDILNVVELHLEKIKTMKRI